jgi:hypothetical protein
MTGTVGIKGKLSKLSTFTGNTWTKIQEIYSKIMPLNEEKQALLKCQKVEVIKFSKEE